MTVRPGDTGKTAPVVTAALDEKLRLALAVANWTVLFTPSNLAEERERFLAAPDHGPRPNPRFVYPNPRVEPIKELLGTLSESRLLAEVPEPILSDYRDLVDDAVRNLEMILAFTHDEDEETERCARLLFGGSDEGLLSAARALVGDSSVPIRRATRKGRSIEAAELAAALSQRLRLYGLDWEIRLVRDSVARVWVDPLEQRITIDSDAAFWERDIAKLQTHEIDTHVLRAQNGRDGWTAGIFELGFAGSEETDEGLALWNESSQGTFDHESERLIALHVLGIDFAARNSFSDTFGWVRDYFPDEPEFAFNRTLRWKRGFHAQDTPLSFSKDLVYFRGLEEVRRYFQSGGDLRNLYVGRTSLRSIPADWTRWTASFFRGAYGFPRLPPFADSP